MPGLQCCGVRGIWVFSSDGDVLCSRRFPVVERQWRLLCSGALGTSSSSRLAASGAEPLPFDSEVYAAVSEALNSANGDGEDAEAPVRGSIAWQLGNRALLLASSTTGGSRGSLRRLESATETGLPHEEVGVVSGELPVQPGSSCWPLLASRDGGWVVALAPLIPQLLSDTALEDLIASQSYRGRQGAWPDLSLANSLALTASLELMDLLFARLPAHTGAAKQHSRDVEAAAASMRAFVSSSLPLGSYTGLPPLEGDPKARIPHGPAPGGSGCLTVQPAWKPQLLAGNKQRMQISLIEFVSASLASGATVPTPGSLPATDMQVHGRLEVLAELKGVPTVSIPVKSSGSPMKALCFECCQAVNPKLRPRESVSEITLQVLPPLKPFAAARYASELNGESLPQLPFTGSFAVSRKPGAGQAFAFNMELTYHALGPKTTLEKCTVELSMPDEVVALEGANTSAGSLVLQGGRVIWRQLGGRLSARNAKATCSGVAVQAQAAGKSSASPLPPSPPIHNLGMDQYQAVRGCRPAWISFLIKGATLSGVSVSSHDVTLLPPSKDLPIDVTAQVQSKDYLIWSRPQATQ